MDRSGIAVAQTTNRKAWPGSRWMLVALALAVAGCGSNPPAPVIDAGSRATSATGGEYVVRGGDTLYAIAFRYGTSFQKLAAANGISPPYTIYPGQRLRVDGSGQALAADSGSGSGARRPARPTGDTSSTSKSAPTTVRTAAGPEPDWSATSAEGWRWPTRGKVRYTFSERGTVHKGIDIVGDLGQSVTAARSGKVVYAGDGLKAYGLLVIIKHDESYLSAYAYNSKVLVKEGDWVNAGQQIADMGQRDDGAVMLHFEVRRDGKPQDPLRYLKGGGKP